MRQLAFILFLLGPYAFAQNLEKKVDALNGKSLQFMRDPGRMNEITDSALSLASEIRYQQGLAAAHKFRGIYYYFVSDFDSSLYHHRKSLALNKELQDSLEIGKSYLNLATTSQATGDYPGTIENALKSIEFFEPLGDTNGKGRALNLLGIVSFSQELYDDALTYFRRYLKNARTASDSMQIASSYGNIGAAFEELGQIDSALDYFHTSVEWKKELGATGNLGNTYQNMAGLYADQNRFALASDYYRKALTLYREVGDRRFESEVWLNLGIQLKNQEKYDSAALCLNRAAEISEETSSLPILKLTLEQQADVFHLLGRHRDAYLAQRSYSVLSDSLLNQQRLEKIAELETSFQTREKEQKIEMQNASLLQQQAQIQRNIITILALLSIIVLLVVIYVQSRNKAKKDQELLIQQQETKSREKQIEASIQSQEMERKRFAQDLHDGFGQLISSLRLQIQNIDDNNKRTEKEHAFEQAEKTLEEMHGELRNIAFNLMPTVLIKYGIVPAIREFADRLNQSNRLQIELQAFGLNDQRLPELIEISIYRIAQEWINNIIKYSTADQITIQLVGHEKEISVTIEDNGRGFDPKILEQSAGNGWQNILSRAKLVKGTVEVDSDPARNGSILILSVPLGKMIYKTSHGKKRYKNTDQHG